MSDNPLSVSTVEPEHRDWCPHGEPVSARVIDFEPLAITGCEYAYMLRCRLCGGLGLVDVIAKPGWRAHITEMRYDPKRGALVNFVGEKA